MTAAFCNGSFYRPTTVLTEIIGALRGVPAEGIAEDTFRGWSARGDFPFKNSCGLFFAIKTFPVP